MNEMVSMRLTFIINNPYVIIHTLSNMRESRFSSTEYRDDIVALQNFAWRQSERCYDFLTGRLAPATYFAAGGSVEEIAQFFARIEQSNAFRTVQQQTKAYMHAVRAQWERTYPAASQAMQEMTGLDLHKEMTVIITHPSLRNGQYVGNNTIAWGHQEDWENYSTVYLWHEALHSYFDTDDISHALIQLIADNELRTRLNAGTPYPPFTGHEDLFPLMAKIEPYWRTYLEEARRNGSGDIRTFQAKIQNLPEMKKQTVQHDSHTAIE